MKGGKWIAVLLGLIFFAASVDYAFAVSLARGRAGYVSTPMPPSAGIVPGTLAPGTCVGCTDSEGSAENYTYGNNWYPRQQPAQQGSPTSPYYNSDAMAVWIGPQLDTINTVSKKCFVANTPAGAASGNLEDRGIDHATFDADGSDNVTSGHPAVTTVTVSNPQGDPQDYPITAVVGDGTTSVATVSVPFAFPAPLNFNRTNLTITWSGTTETVTYSDTATWNAGTLVSITGATPSNLNVTNAVVLTGATGGVLSFTNSALSGSGSASVAGNLSIVNGYGYHVAISGYSGAQSSLNGSFALSNSTSVDETHSSATVSFPNSFNGTAGAGTLDVTEPMYWCVTIDPSLFNDGLHNIRAGAYPKIGWPRLLQGPHYISLSGSNTGIDEANGTGIFTAPAHGFSNQPVTIDSESTAGCLTLTGGPSTSAQNYRIAILSNPGTPQNVRPPISLRGYQFGLFDAHLNTVVNMQGCTDDGIVINDFRGVISSGAHWMPYGSLSGDNLLPALRQTHDLWFFTNAHGTASNPTINISSKTGSATLGCGSGSNPACDSIDDAIALNPNLNPNTAANVLGANTCVVTPVVSQTGMTTPVSSANGSCSLNVGQALWTSHASAGVHVGLPYWVVGVNGEAAGTALTPGTTFLLASTPLASLTGGSAPSCGSAPATVICATAPAFLFCGTIRANLICMHEDGGGITLALSGTPSAPEYYSFGSQLPSSTPVNDNGPGENANLAQWMTIKGATHDGVIINQSGHAVVLTDSSNHVFRPNAASWTATGVISLTFPNNVGLVPAAGAATLSGLTCPTGLTCGNPNGAITINSGASTTTAVIANSAFTPSVSSGAFVPVNVNVGNGYTLTHLQNLSICGLDQSVNGTNALCSPTDPNPYSMLVLGPGGSPFGGGGGALWLDDVTQVGAGYLWGSGTCNSVSSPVACSTNSWGIGLWQENNSISWNMLSGPINGLGPGWSANENSFYKNNAGQYETTSLSRNVTNDGLQQVVLSQIDCTDWIAAGNPGGVCNNSGGASQGTITNQNLVPLTGMNYGTATTQLDFSKTITPFGGTYASRFGWAPSANNSAWSINTGANINSSTSGSSSTILACYDASLVAPNCPASVGGSPVAAVAPCVAAVSTGHPNGVSCIVFVSGTTASTSNAIAALALFAGEHLDAMFFKESNGNSGTGSDTDIMIIGFTIPNKPCDYTTTLPSCNGSEGIITQPGVLADMTLDSVNIGQLSTLEPAIHPSEYFENFYIKNTNLGGQQGEILGGWLAGRGFNFYGSPLMPPGGGFYGNGKIDGLVVDNSICEPASQLLAPLGPLYYAYWAQSIQGDGNNATMVFGDAGITIPASTPITTLSAASIPNSVYNPIDVISSITWASNVATVTFSPAVTIPGGTSVTISGAVPANLNGDFTTLASPAPSAGVLSVANTVASTGATTPGSISINGYGTTSNNAGAIGGTSNSSMTWSGTTSETVHGLPGVTLTAGTSVTIANTSPDMLTVTGNVLASPAPGSGFFSIVPGKYSISSSTYTPTTQTVIFASNDIIPIGASVNVSALNCTAHPCGGTPTGTFTVVSSSAGTITFANTFTISGGSIALTNSGAGVTRNDSGTATGAGTTYVNIGANKGGGFNVASANVVNTTAGQVQWASTTNLPIMLDPAAPGTLPGLAGFAIVPTGNGTHEDAASYVNSPAVNACTN